MSAPARYAFGDFVLEPAQARLLGPQGTPVNLSPRLFSALLLLVEHAGELLDKDTLMRALWPGLVVEENNLSQVVSGLRRALDDDSHGSRFIQTVPRRGFRFIAPVQVLGEAPVVLPEPLVDAPERRRWLGLALTAAGVGAASGLAWWSRRVGGGGDPRTATLAVLPFKPLSRDDRDELLELGMADSLIARLSVVPGLVVRSAGSMQHYAGVVQDPMRAAQELNVTWILDGSLQRSGDQLRVTARLLKALDGSAVWSSSFDEKYTSVFDVQDQISARVMQALLPTLQGGARADTPLLSEIGGTRSTEAYQLYLAAAWRAQGTRADATAKAVALLGQALEIDPAYSIAWAQMAWVHRRKLWRNDAVPAEVFSAADAALKRALAVTPQLAQARAGQAFATFWYAFDWPGAEREFRAALNANPNEVSARWGLAQMLLTQGRINEGFEQMRLARELDPMSPVLNTLEASFLLDRGMLSEARRRLNRALDIAPEHGLAFEALGMLLVAEGKLDEGIQAARRAVELSDGTSKPKARLAVLLAGHGQTAEARTLRDEMLAAARTRFVPATALAAVHAALGDDEAALSALELAYVQRDTRLIYLKDDACWSSLRKAPQFVALMKTLRMDQFGPGLTSV